MHVLVTGATGFVGSHLVPTLLDHNHEVTIVTRDQTSYTGPSDVTVLEGDMTDEESVTFPDDIDAAYYLIHSLHAGDGFDDLDEQCARTFQQLADEAGVSHVIYLSGLGVDGDDLSRHLESRQTVEHVLNQGTYQTTVLRTAVIIGAGSDSFQIIHQLAARLPVMITPRWVRTESQPIAIQDVIAYLIAVLDDTDIHGRTYEIGGPDIVTYQEMLSMTRTLLGGRQVIVPAPVLTPRLSAHWVELFTDVDPNLINGLVDGLRNRVVVTDETLHNRYDIDRTPVKDAIRIAIEESDAVSLLPTG